MKLYENLFKIADEYKDIKSYPYPTIEESLKFASEQILEGYRDEFEALEDAESMDETGNIRFCAFGLDFGSNDIRAAVDLDKQYHWNILSVKV